jgi:hypothetical protein
MVRSWEMDECWGGKLDLVWIFHGIYRRFGVIPQVFLSSLLFFLFGDFQSLFLVIFFRWTLCGFCEGCTHNPLVVIFLVPPSQIRGNMCSIWGFLEISWRGLLGVHLLIPLDLVSLGAQIIAMRCPWGTHTIPKSRANPWSESGDREGSLEELTCGSLFIPSAQAVTSLSGALHRSERCCSLLGFGPGERSGVLVCLSACNCFEFVLVWPLECQVLALGFFLLGPIWPVCYTGLISVGLFRGKLQVLLGWPD